MMNSNLFLLLTKVLFVGAITSSYNEEPTAVDYQKCVCVPFWKCKDYFNDISDESFDIMDISEFVRKMRKYGNTINTRCTGDFDVCCRIECGRRYLDVRVEYDGNNVTISPRIFKGNDAEFAEFPWMLAILHEKMYKCGASLVHPQVAITAAHCVNEFEKYEVRAGEWNAKSNKERLPHQDRMTRKVIIHPQYHPEALINDIAILILETPFRLAENVGIICLPPPGGLYRNTTTCTVSGWGKNSWKKGTYQAVLKKIDISIVPKHQCIQSLRDAKLGPQFQLHPSFLCAGDGSKDACKGDGGSPLFCQVEGKKDRYEQVGIVSWGLTCGLYKTPGVYVDLGLFIEWIDEELDRYKFNSSIYKY